MNIKKALLFPLFLAAGPQVAVAQDCGFNIPFLGPVLCFTVDVVGGAVDALATVTTGVVNFGADIVLDVVLFFVEATGVIDICGQLQTEISKYVDASCGFCSTSLDNTNIVAGLSTEASFTLLDCTTTGDFTVTDSNFGTFVIGDINVDINPGKARVDVTEILPEPSFTIQDVTVSLSFEGTVKTAPAESPVNAGDKLEFSGSGTGDIDAQTIVVESCMAAFGPEGGSVTPCNCNVPSTVDDCSDGFDIVCANDFFTGLCIKTEDFI